MEFLGQTIKGKVVQASYGLGGGKLELVLCEKDRKTFKLERVTLQFFFPWVLPVEVGDEIIAYIEKPIKQYLVINPDEKPYLILKGDTFFETY